MAKFHYVDPDEASKDPFASDSEKSEFEQLLEKETEWVASRRFRTGEAISGKVVQVGQDYLFVDLGGKLAGSVALDEFRNAEANLIPKIGEEVNLFVREDNGSEILLTRSLRASEADDLMLRNAFEQQIPVEAKVEKTIKGGFEALIGTKRAFVPMSNMDLFNVDDPEKYLGKVFKFNIITFAQGGRNIVLSRKSILREEREQEVHALLNTLAVGDLRQATITRLVAFGAFADIGGVEGLIPISELSWAHVKKIEDVVKVGEKLNIKITKIEHSPKLKIGLTVKGAGEDPWVSMATRMSVGETLSGKVMRLSDFGAFVSVSDGVEGLVHISQLSWDKKVNHPREILAEGQSVVVHVLSVDIENRKLGLSFKGPMPADLSKRLEAKKRGQQDLTSDEQALVTEWNEYQKTSVQLNKNAAGGNVFASAFEKAKTRKT